ncbi:unnamed protein product [Bemisia tabaci]|uniref:Transposase domain-containing protein n=1 Tax=Bemisia tabaci TaxID=7038 RepID=A0A9P0F3C9_BEMTA|nr:unnamed protein product [Bemisia tabaci]
MQCAVQPGVGFQNCHSNPVLDFSLSHGEFGSDSNGDDGGPQADSPFHSVYDSSDSDDSFVNVDFNSDSGESDFDSEADLSEVDEDREDEPKRNLSDCLQSWGNRFKIKKDALSALLRILKAMDPADLNSLPLDSRTLLKTPRKVDVKKLEKAGGEYYHFGFLHGIQNALSRSRKRISNVVVVVGLNGLPLFKSSGVHFTPILGSIASNGYCSCTKCIQKGVWSALCNRTYYPEVDSVLKTHDDFINKTVPAFHLRDSPLLRIPRLNFIDNFPLDYLHLICVGVVKTLVKLWVFKSKNNAKSLANSYPSSPVD